MLDSAIKLAQCQRCGGYVWAADVSGGRVAVDPLPLGDLGAVMGALAAMRSVYEVRHHGSKPHHLKWLGGQGTRWEPEGRTLVAAHGCGAPARDARPVEVTPEGPQQAPVTPGRHSDGGHHPTARADGSQGHTAPRRPVDSSASHPSRAGRATRPRSDVTPMTRTLKCSECGQSIRAGEEFTAIECGQYSWAQHSYPCTDSKRKRPTQHVGWDAADQLYRRGDWDRAVENVIEGL